MDDNYIVAPESDKSRIHTILIVEDDDEVAILLKDVLQNNGYRVLVESKGENVLAKITNDPPALVLLDIRLSGIDGYTVCRRIKRDKDFKDLPIIFISALKTENDVLEAKDAGGVYFFRKPFDINALLKKIKEVITNTSLSLGLNRHIPKVLYAQPDYVVGPIHAMFDLFQTHGYEVHVVRDSREIVRQANTQRPDIIVLDLDEALLNVWTVAEALWRNRQAHDIPIVVLTGQIDRDAGLQSKVPSVVSILEKPVATEKLFKTFLKIMMSRVSNTP